MESTKKVDAVKLEERAKEYLKAFDSIKEWTHDERSAMAILQEVTKDIRMAQIREERANGVSLDHFPRDRLRASTEIPYPGYL